MNPGKLDRRILVQVKTTTRDETGGRSESWATAFSCWAGLVKMTQRVSEISDSEKPNQTKHFLIRWRSDIGTATHRIQYGNKTFQITGLIEDGRKEGLILEARQIEGLEL